MGVVETGVERHSTLGATGPQPCHAVTSSYLQGAERLSRELIPKGSDPLGMRQGVQSQKQ